jgi:hypothetical protein
VLVRERRCYLVIAERDGTQLPPASCTSFAFNL